MLNFKACFSIPAMKSSKKNKTTFIWKITLFFNLVGWQKIRLPNANKMKINSHYLLLARSEWLSPWEKALIPRLFDRKNQRRFKQISFLSILLSKSLQEITVKFNKKLSVIIRSWTVKDLMMKIKIFRHRVLKIINRPPIKVNSFYFKDIVTE